MSLRKISNVVLAGSLALAPVPVWAQPAAPDVIRLEDGGLLRGTIVEKVAGEKVTIMLLTGETRTVAMDQVSYAGPADEAPKGKPTAERAEPQPKPMVTVRTDEARLKLVVGDTPLTWHTSKTSGVAYGPGGFAVAQSFDRLCTAPCEVDMPVGSHRFALSADGGIPISTRDPIDITGDGELVGSYKDNSTTRGVLIGAGVVAIIVGGVLMLAPLFDAADEVDDLGYEDEPEFELGAGFYLGMTLMIGGSIMPLFSPPDRATVDYRPR